MSTKMLPLIALIVVQLFNQALAESAAQSSEQIEKFKQVFGKKLAGINPAFRIGSVDVSDLPNFYEVQIDDGPLLYVRNDGDYMMMGTLFQLSGKELTNLTEKRANKARLKLMPAVKKADAIVFAPKAPQKVKANIYVFTDVDCGYCRKLHGEVAKLNAAGISVHYLAFPRAGIGSASYKKIATAWCTKDRQDTMNRLKNNEPVAIVSCENPVPQQYDLGKKMGINGTPAILLEDGTLIPGYRSAEDLIKIILK